VADDIVPNNILIYAKTETEHISPAEQARADQLGSYAIALGWGVEGYAGAACPRATFLHRPD
jgi:hypothetical protein